MDLRTTLFELTVTSPGSCSCNGCGPSCDHCPTVCRLSLPLSTLFEVGAAADAADSRRGEPPKALALEDALALLFAPITSSFANAELVMFMLCRRLHETRLNFFRGCAGAHVQLPGRLARTAALPTL